MSGIRKEGLIGLGLAFWLSLVLTVPVSAGLRVDGAKIEAGVSPGSVAIYEMKVSDTSDTPMDIAIEVKGYGEAESGVQVLDPEEDNTLYSAREYLSVSPDRFHLEVGESRDVTVTAKIPVQVGGGGRYAIIYIHTVPPEGASFATVTAVAARVLLTIEGSELIKSGDIDQIQLEKSESGQPLEISAMVKNTGNYHYQISAMGKIKNSRGEVVATSLPLPTQFPLIPAYSRRISIPFEAVEALPPGEYQADIEVKAEDGSSIARETNAFQLGDPWEPPPSDVKLPQEQTINWTLIGGICGGMMVLALVIYLMRKRRHTDEDEQKVEGDIRLDQ